MKTIHVLVVAAAIIGTLTVTPLAAASPGGDCGGLVDANCWSCGYDSNGLYYCEKCLVYVSVTYEVAGELC